MILVCSLVSVPRTEAELNRKDRAALLLSTQLQFNSDNIPLIPVGIVEGADEVRFSVKSGLVVLPDGPGGSEIELPGPGTFTVRVEGGVPAQVQYFPVVANLPAGDMDAIRQVVRRWEERYFKVQLVELGSVFGFYGRVLDSRTVLVAINKPEAAFEKAEEVAQTLASAYADADIGVHAELAQPQRGTVVLTNGTVTIRNPNLLELRSLSGDPVIVKSVEFGKGFAWHGREDRSYRGDLVLAVGRGGNTAVVNINPAETILKGLVPSEIYTTSPTEALKAQAIVARGELLSKIGHRHLADPFFVCADVHCQVYKGIGKEEPRSSAAVDATKGRLLFHGATLVDAYYSANCGGHTENNEDVWAIKPKPSLRGIVDTSGAKPEFARVDDSNIAAFLDDPSQAYCSKATLGSANFRWTVTRTSEQLADSVAKIKPVGHVLEVVVLERGVSGRAKKVEVRGVNGTVILAPELRIRQALGGLKSSMFVVEKKGGTTSETTQFVFRGGGFGHGVGMCQTGAIGAAEAGDTHDAILRHYYQGSELQTIY